MCIFKHKDITFLLLINVVLVFIISNRFRWDYVSSNAKDSFIFISYVLLVDYVSNNVFHEYAVNSFISFSVFPIFENQINGYKMSHVAEIYPTFMFRQMHE